MKITKDTSVTPKPRTNWRIILAYLSMSLAHTQCGFSTASISGFQGMVGFLAAYGHTDPRSKTGWNMGTTPQQLAASFVNFGTMAGILAAKPMSRYLGRRQGLWVASVVSVLGSGLQLKSSNVAGLYARRIVIGMSNGLFMTFARSYAFESTPAHLKDRTVALFAVWVGIGNLMGAVVNKFTAQIHSSWAYKIPLTCHIAIPSFLVAMVVFVPESPVWLLAQGRVNEARRALSRLRNDTLAPDVLEMELLEMQIRVEAQSSSDRRRQYLEIWRTPNRRGTILCLAVILSNSSSGIWLMLSYGTVVFQLAGIKAAFQASIYNNLFNLLGICVGLYLYRYTKMPRRTMMMTGHFVPALCMLVVAVAFAVAENDRCTRMIVLASLIVHGFFYNAGSFVLSSPLSGEMVSSRLRDVTVGLGTGLTAFTMPYFINPRELNWGPTVAYIWAGCNAITGVFFFLLLPETRGRTHSEIDEIFGARPPPESFASRTSDDCPRRLM